MFQQQQKALKVALAPFTVLTGLWLATPSMAIAEETNASLLEEITVTARRREESLFETPVSVRAFTNQELDQRQIEYSYQIAESTPNLVFRRDQANSTGANVYIRGIGQSDFNPVVQPGVGIYVDGAYIGRTSAAITNMMDIESVQVLRGPQGTLFGRNTIGGAILINSNKPSDKFEGDVRVKIGEFSQREVKGSLNVPLTDNLFVKFVAMKNLKDGFIDTPNIPGDDGWGSDDTTAARIALRWLTNDSITVDWNVDYSQSYSDGAPLVLGSMINDFLPGTTAALYNTRIAPATGGPLYLNAENFKALDAYSTNASFAKRYDYQNWGSNLQVAWDFGKFILNSITTYREVDGVGGQDIDHSIAPVNHRVDTNQYEQYSQEFRISSNEEIDDRLHWTVGMYYFHEDALNFNDVLFPNFSARSGSTVKNKSFALFGQFTYELTEQMNVTIGGRYTDEQLNDIVDDRVQFLTRLFSGGVFRDFPPPPAPGAFKIVPNQTFESDHTDFEPYFNIAYNWTDKLMTYFTYSEGFKGGGFTQRISPGNIVRSFRPEFAKVYELGAKWSGDIIGLTGAVFYNDYTDLQVATNRELGGTTENAADAEIYGGELEVLAAVTDRLQLSAGLGRLHGEYKKLNPVVAFPITNRLPSVMDWQANASAVYRFPLGPGQILLRLDYSFMDDHFVEADNIPEAKIDSYSLLNGGITYISKSEKWEFAVQGRNLTDKVYFVTASQSPRIQGWTQVLLMPPRQFSATVRYLF